MGCWWYASVGFAQLDTQLDTPADATSREADASLAEAEPAPARENEATDAPRRLAMPIGLELGWRGDGDTKAALVGGELTLVWYRSNGDTFNGAADGSLALGVVLGGIWVSEPSHFRGSVGLQLVGYFGEAMAGGVEACVTLHTRGDLAGFRARGFLGWYGPSVYVGVDYHGGFAAELGVLLKVPIAL